MYLSERTPYYYNGAKEAIFKSVTSGMELYNAFQDDVRNKNNQSFQKWLLDFVFTMTYKPENKKV